MAAFSADFNVRGYICSECGYEAVRWEGQCRECGGWNTLEEVEISAKKSSRTSKKSSLSKPKARKLSQVNPSSFKRIGTKIPELDQVLSGGFVPGQAVLLAGQPGIGKSTILLQIAQNFPGKVLYMSGEESESQIALRAHRIIDPIDHNHIEILASTNLSDVLITFKHELLIIDSIQAIQDENLDARMGAPTQLRECTARLIAVAKSNQTPVILVGHITKEGIIAGPKILEHMVDTVLYLEGDKTHLYRILRVQKNRFGSDSEIGLFEMKERGLISVSNAGNVLSNNVAEVGSVTALILEGTRTFAVKVQTLNTKTVFGYPKRASSGTSINRLQLLCAVIQKNLGINLVDQDVYINVASGMIVKEPAIDLAICCAILSSYKNKGIAPDIAFTGEVGLSGEVLSVIGEDRRIADAKKLGYKTVVSGKNIKNLKELQKYLL